MQERMLTPAQAARELGASVNTLYALLEQGRIRATRISRTGKRGRWLIPESSLSHFLQPAPSPEKVAGLLQAVRLALAVWKPQTDAETLVKDHLSQVLAQIGA